MNEFKENKFDNGYINISNNDIENVEEFLNNKY